MKPNEEIKKIMCDEIEQILKGETVKDVAGGLIEFAIKIIETNVLTLHLMVGSKVAEDIIDAIIERMKFLRKIIATGEKNV